MRTLGRRAPALVAFILLVTMTLAAQAGHARAGSPQSPLRDLKSLDDLREVFNHDTGKIRLLLLLSPT